MKILSHRGYWISEEEKNTPVAFSRSFEGNFGLETDIRDYCGDLVIAHDVASFGSYSFQSLLELIYRGQDPSFLTLALNIKADGLVNKLLDILNKFPAVDYFAFDMSIPEMRRYLTAGLPVFTRMSEVESSPIWLAESSGVWLDGFDEVWFSMGVIQDLLSQDKLVCVVSPELHGRDYMDLWKDLKKFSNDSRFYLCTDFPETAKAFFSIN